jgi:hypothetical protein
MTTEVAQLAAIVEELIAVMQIQARELESLITHVEQVTTRLPEASELSVIRSELASLHVRARQFRAGPEAGP